MEAMQKLSDPVLQDCPECGQPSLNKLMSASAFRLKGGGWYETDFKKSDQRNVAKDDSAGGGACTSTEKAAGACACDNAAAAKTDGSASATAAAKPKGAAQSPADAN
jgi:putative FmdB family regulatory protein